MLRRQAHVCRLCEGLVAYNLRELNGAKQVL